ncbi:MAG: TlpA family protein disulfide reductase [Candidatus Omnitrophica bacterium]|nr:TlpA family protein disulfide reductase [Candidatus Omnitrophota bacterium]
MKKLYSTKLIISFFLLILMLVPAKAAWGAGKKLVGKKAPEISISKIFNAKQKHSLKSLRGQVVLLEFWATWCPPCIKAMPHLEKLHNKYKNKGLVIISISAEKESAIKKFVKSKKLTFPVAIDSGRKTNSSYGIKSIPTAYLIDAAGKVIWQGHTMNLKNETIKKALKEVKIKKKNPLPVW